MPTPIKQKIEEFLDNSSEDVLEILLDIRNSDEVLEDIVSKYWDDLQKIWATLPSKPSACEAHRIWEKQVFIPALAPFMTTLAETGPPYKRVAEAGLLYKWLARSFEIPVPASRDYLIEKFRKECYERELETMKTIETNLLYDVGRSIGMNLPPLEEFPNSPAYRQLRTLASKTRYSRKRQSD